MRSARPLLAGAGLGALACLAAAPLAAGAPDPWTPVSSPGVPSTSVVGAVGPGAGTVVASPGVYGARRLVSRPLGRGPWRTGTLATGAPLVLPDIDTVAGATRTDVVYAAGQGIGVLRSLDGGLRWADAGTGPVEGQIATSPDGVTVLTTAAGPEPRALISPDRGLTWRSSPLVAGAIPLSSWGASAVAVRPDRPSTMVVAGSGRLAGAPLAWVRGVVVSTDAGRSWALRRAGGAGTPLAATITGGGRPVIVIATATGIHRSADLGRRWRRVAQVPRARPAVSLSRLVSTAGPDPRILYGDMNGVWIGCRRGTSWRLAARRPAGMVPYDVALSADGRRAVVSGRGGVTTAPLAAFPCA